MIQVFYGLFHLYYRIRMNYNQINRNSLMSCIYSDRPGYNCPPNGEGWRQNEQHLNPSKSKLNVRQSLNKTVETPPVQSSTQASIRNSCLFASSNSAHPPRNDSFVQDKFFKASKENQQPVSNPREHFPRYSQLAPPSEQRRKSESAHLRAASSNDFLFKLEQFRPFDIEPNRSQKQERPQRGDKTPQADTQLREMILALTKRVANSEEEIGRLKERHKRVQGVEGEVGEFKGKLLQLAKFQSKGHTQMEAKLQQNQQEMRERLASCEESVKRMGLLERGFSELVERVRNRQETGDRQVNGQLQSLQNSLRKTITEEVALLRNSLEPSKKENSTLSDRIKRLQSDLSQRGHSFQEHRKSTRKSVTSVMLQNKEVLLIRQNQPVRDRTRQLNLPQSSRRELAQDRHQYLDTPRKELVQGKRELIIRQKVYFIDTSGYLLDQNRYYLLNSKNQQILLPQHMISALRDNHMLATPLTTPRR